MIPSLPVALLVLLAVLLLMLVELQLSLANERSLRAKGAIEPPDDPFPLMRVVYPLGFVLMAIEGATHAALRRDLVLLGLLLFGVAKALKFWAISALGSRWSYRVLVPPHAPLVTSGPYRLVRHPNYLAVLGEFVSIAIALSAPVTGTIATAVFGWILWKRIQVEERALGMK